MAENWLSIICVSIAVSCVFCAPVIQVLSPPTNEELRYMKTYGYLPEVSSAGDSDEALGLAYSVLSVADAVRKLQAFIGIPVTEVLDTETKKLFTKRRCGVKDIVDRSRQRRFAISKGWPNKTITYRVLNGSRTLSKRRVEQLTAEALAVWVPHGDLRFVQLQEGKADIEMSFGAWDHGDNWHFDGRGNVLAHAFAPPTGSIHFDDDENWVDGADDEPELADFLSVAVHEIGHSLGLMHSNVTSAVMFPLYQDTMDLDADDIQAMRQLYFKDQLSESATETNLVAPSTRIEPEPEDAPDLCLMNYDTIQAMQGRIFVFEDEWMWILRDRKEIEPGFPRKIRDVFTGLPQHVDVIRAVYERPDGTIVIFSGRKYYEFDATFRLKHKRNLSRYKLPRHVSELSSVFRSNYNNKTYLIAYERFWRFDEEVDQMDERYPKSMTAWRDLPYPVDAAMVWDGDTFFFQGPRFWRFDNTQIQAHSHYPLPIAPVWFPCQYTVEMLSYTRNIT